MSRAMSDEARFELAMAAAGRARRNRPTALVVAGAAALALAAVLTIWGVSARATAWAALKREQGASASLDLLRAEWERLDEAQREGGDSQAGRVIRDLQAQMESLATRAGMKAIPNHPRIPTPSLRGGVQVYEYHYSEVRDPELKALVEWMRLATTEIPGLEVYSVILTPEANNWKLDVTFRRWQREGT
jgi:hypothetical protein